MHSRTAGSRSLEPTRSRSHELQPGVESRRLMALCDLMTERWLDGALTRLAEPGEEPVAAGQTERVLDAPPGVR